MDSATTRFALAFPLALPWGILLRSRCISGANRHLGLAITLTAEIHGRCLMNGIVDCDAVLLSQLNTVALLRPDFARLDQLLGEVYGLSVHW